MDVLLERRRVAVVEVEARGPRLELVREVAARLDDLEDAVHVRRVDPVEVDRVRVRAVVPEAHAERVALGRADDRPGHGAVVRPRREEDARGDLEVVVDGDELVLADAARLVRAAPAAGRGARRGRSGRRRRAPRRRSSPRGPVAPGLRATGVPRVPVARVVVPAAPPRSRRAPACPRSAQPRAERRRRAACGA